eukprot:CAMPEP_0185709410 /NCGR_PEP_ID=MMETSP1164-20130828/28595_1 /TAXON_ID=1104430 /ORGANISM="Chrysoreinhardia sp, Strain CCMP2950" /LENGTH=314 /DNA_ID=CAMNT_0028376903 /DNA_START=51 /DNA_END=993 /DNA_ORIENTATION=-
MVRSTSHPNSAAGSSLPGAPPSHEGATSSNSSTPRRRRACGDSVARKVVGVDAAGPWTASSSSPSHAGAASSSSIQKSGCGAAVRNLASWARAYAALAAARAAGSRRTGRGAALATCCGARSRAGSVGPKTAPRRAALECGGSAEEAGVVARGHRDEVADARQRGGVVFGEGAARRALLVIRTELAVEARDALEAALVGPEAAGEREQALDGPPPVRRPVHGVGAAVEVRRQRSLRGAASSSSFGRRLRRLIVVVVVVGDAEADAVDVRPDAVFERAVRVCPKRIAGVRAVRAAQEAAHDFGVPRGLQHHAQLP